MEAKRNLIKVNVNFISLVQRGANKKQIIYKSGEAEDSFNKTIPLLKVDEEKHLVYGIVYSPDETDLQGDIACREVIEQMAYSFMKEKKTGNIDKQHNFNPAEGFVAESWIIKSPDPLFPEEKDGSWAVAIKIENNETWELIKQGEITGLSLAGFAEVEEIEKGGIISKLKNLIGRTHEDSPSLRKEELAKSVIDQLTPSIEEIRTKIESINDSYEELNKRIAAIEKSNLGSRQTILAKNKPASGEIFDWFAGINELENH